MAQKDALDDGRKAPEEEFLREKERELLERMQERSAATEGRSELAESPGVADEAILQSLHELGYTRETVTLMHLVPLVHVAWVDGGVSQRERDLIFEVAASRGVAEGTDAWR